MRWLIYGGKGWIGKMVVDILEEKGETTYVSGKRLDNICDVFTEIQHVKPDRVICCTGRTHGGEYKTIDYLEQPGKLQENIKDNLFCPVSLALLCNKIDVHLTYLGTGCIFTDNDALKKRNLVWCII